MMSRTRIFFFMGLGRAVSAWVGDRTWSWTKFRLDAAQGVQQLEALANEGRQHAVPTSVTSTVTATTATATVERDT